MSARATNEWKVGAFIVGLVILFVAALFWLGARRFDTETVQRVTYFDESVQGLEVGAPVKIRGVTIGKVIEILLAPDRRLVEVRSEIRVEAMRKINAISQDSVADPTADSVSPEMRVIIAAQGITGVKFLEADFFPPWTPRLELSFDPPPTYIPSAPSTLKSLEDAIRGLGEELPTAVAQLRSLGETLESRIASIDTEALSREAIETLALVRATIDGTAESGIGPELRALLEELTSSARSLDATLSELRGEGGAIQLAATSFDDLSREVQRTMDTATRALVEADLPATTKSVRDAADQGAALASAAERLVGAELARSLKEMSGTLRRLEKVLALIERDPGIFLRGRGRSGGQ